MRAGFFVENGEDVKREKFDLEIMDYIAKNLDEALAKNGFDRGAETRHYARAIGESQQTIIFHFEANPRDNPHKEILIRPKIQVVLPALSQVARDLTQNNALILPAPDIVIAAPLCPNFIDSIPIGWFANSEQEREEAMSRACAGVLAYGIPFLNEITTARSLISFYEDKDCRLKMDGRMLVFIIAAYVLCDEPKKAHDLAQQRFSKGAMAKHYRVLLEKMTAL